jgi:hypothetical protein
VKGKTSAGGNRIGPAAAARKIAVDCRRNSQKLPILSSYCPKIAAMQRNSVDFDYQQIE